MVLAAVDTTEAPAADSPIAPPLDRVSMPVIETEELEVVGELCRHGTNLLGALTRRTQLTLAHTE